MILCVSIEKHPEIQQGVRAVLDTWNHGTWGKCSLFDVSVEVLWVPIQDELSHLMQLKHSESANDLKWRGCWENTYRKLSFRPDLRDIERVKPELLGVCLIRIHDLNMQRPRHRDPFLNCFPKVSLRVIRIFTAQPGCFIGCELLLTRVRKEMVLDIDKFSFLIDPECFRR